MELWDYIASVAHDWYACTLSVLFMGFAMGLMLADSYHTVRCNSKVHRRNWFLELIGRYDK